MTEQPPPEDDRTVIRPASSSTGGRSSQWANSSQFLGHTLPEGSWIDGLEIIGLIGEGGFGIVYLAYDPSLERRVALKEYMPSSLASRASGSPEVIVKSERHVETFQAGLKSFVNEARLLARFDHPSLVKVYRFWEGHSTAYMVMPYYEGPTLKRALTDLGGAPDEAMLREWLWPLLDALEVLHTAQCFHRDIAPDNILLTERGPLLLDFGAARRVIGDMTQALTVVLKPGYAPIEQYGDSPAMTQGAWTDIYALACVVHCAITGKPPKAAVERMMVESLQPLSTLAAGRYSGPFLAAIDQALSLRPQDRPQSIAEFRALLDGIDPASLPPPVVAAAGKGAGAGTGGVVRGRSGRTLSGPTTGPVTTGKSRTRAPAPSHAGRTQPPPQPATQAPKTTTAGKALGTAADNTEAGPATARSKVALISVSVAGSLAVAAAIGWALNSPMAPAGPALAAPGVASPAATAAPAASMPGRAEASVPPGLPPASTTAPAAAVGGVPGADLPGANAGHGASAAVAPIRPALAEARPAARARVTAAVPAADARPPKTAELPGRCSDILQKASLETLNSEETRYLQRECR